MPYRAALGAFMSGDLCLSLLVCGVGQVICLVYWIYAQNWCVGCMLKNWFILSFHQFPCQI